jgi:hypothetical protein
VSACGSGTISAGFAGKYFYARLHSPYPSKYIVVAFQDKTAATITTKSYVPYAKAPDGGGWTQAKLNAVMLQPLMDTYTRLYDAWLVVTYNEKPTTAVTGPAGTVTTTVRPDVTWSYSDPESDPMERYRVKVFSSAQYTATAFNPETAVAVWDSGEQLSDALSTSIPINLTNGTSYRAYVKTGDKNSGGRYSNWAYSPFTVNVPAPPCRPSP